MLSWFVYIVRHLRRLLTLDIRKDPIMSGVDVNAILVELFLPLLNRLTTLLAGVYQKTVSLAPLLEISYS
jgi:hypothetical protein